MADPRHDPESGPSKLALRLRKAGASELAELVGDHLEILGPREARHLLLNPYLTPELIEDLAAARHLASFREVRVGIARHPRTREATALRFVPGLFWRELMEISIQIRARPSVRRSAEKTLIQRLPRLATGEKVALGRRASVEVLGHLMKSPDVRVLGAVLENPRLSEGLVLRLLAQRQLGPRVLDLLAASRWGSRYVVRLALALHPMTPFRVAFRLLPTLRSRDLGSVSRAPELSSVVRRRARELLDSARGGGKAVNGGKC